jgi:SAM-dependent methyltransferase
VFEKTQLSCALRPDERRAEQPGTANQLLPCGLLPDSSDSGRTMNPITKAVLGISTRARARRSAFFRACFDLREGTRVLDLGSENGSHIRSVLAASPVRASDVYIADINGDAVEEGRRRFGFVPVRIDESGTLPFDDEYFDIVYCSSVIEHVTLSKERIWRESSGIAFRRASLIRQAEFASEIKRVGKQYFVQTPYRHFPIESHTWLPGLQWLPRSLQLSIVRVTNKVWIKASIPDWSLLDRGELQGLFGDARIVNERFLGLTKSLMAIKSTEPMSKSRPPDMAAARLLI